jgi:hypothetical protein
VCGAVALRLQEYFAGEYADHSSEAPSAKTLSVFKDPSEIKRTVSSISWYPDGGKKLAVAFAILQFQDPRIDKANDLSYARSRTPPPAAPAPAHAHLACVRTQRERTARMRSRTPHGRRRVCAIAHGATCRSEDGPFAARSRSVCTATFGT